MRKNLLITDLDGTLVKNSEKIHPHDLKVFTAIHKKFETGIATGRSIREIEYVEEQLNFEVAVKIAFNGAIMEVNGRRVMDLPIDKKEVKSLLEYLNGREIKFDMLDGETRMGTHQTSNEKTLWNMKLYQPENMVETILGKTIYKINVRPGEHDVDALLEELIQEFSTLAICKSGESRIEVTAPNVSKGRAIEYLKRTENFGPIVAAGDSENDITLFQKSDLSFCIKHAEEDVKQYADFTMDHFSTLQELTQFYE